MATSAAINAQNVASSDVTAFQTSAIIAQEELNKAIVEAKAKETGAAAKEQKPSKLMSTSTVVSEPIQSPAGLGLLSSPAVAKALAAMAPAQKIEFTSHLNDYLKSVQNVKTVLAQVKDPNNPTEAEKAQIVNASINVKQNAQNLVKNSGDGETQVSIWYLLANFMANDIMGINEKEESAAMYQVQANAATLDQINDNLAKLNPTLEKAHHTDIWKSIGFAIASVFCGLILAPFTAGLSLAAGISIAVAFPVCNAEDSNKSQSAARFNFLQDNSADQQALLEASVSQSTLSNIGTQANQSQQTTMQLHVTQTSQIISQAAQQFSEMIQGAAQTANTSSR